MRFVYGHPEMSTCQTLHKDIFNHDYMVFINTLLVLLGYWML